MAALLVFGGVACNGSNPSFPVPEGAAALPATCAPDQPISGATPMRRMTHFEYDNTIRDLFGEDDHPSAAFPPDERPALFDNDADTQTVTRFLAEQYMAAAERIAASAAARFTDLTGCDPKTTGEDECATRFISSIGERAWRRPLTAQESSDLFDAFSADRSSGGFEAGIRTVLEILLQSPEFLYRVELGRDAESDDAGASGSAPASSAGSVPLGPFEVASRLSYLLWGSMPDDELFEAARTGRLETKDDVRAQAVRMLDDPRARTMTDHFYEQWLQLDQLDHLEKDPSVYPKFDPELGSLFRNETLAFVEDVTWNGDGRISTLLTAPYTFVNGKLAAFYGIEGPQGTAFQRVDLPEGIRGGLLTQGSLLSTLAKFDQTSPVHRGKFVRERLFCMTMPPPPANVQIQPPALDPRLTTRERFIDHSQNPACAGCHKLIDPIGLGFENFDGIGLYRETENGQPVDADGELTATDVDGPFRGVPALAARLAASKQVQQCMVLQWFRFGYGRAETAADACTIDVLQDSLSGAQGSLRTLLVTMTQTNAFLFKTTGATSP